MEERRSFVRLDTRLEVTSTVLTSKKAKRSQTKNISGAGLCVFTDEVLSVGTPLRIAVKLPDRTQPVEFTAEVVWSEPYEVIGQESRQRAVETGVRFLDITPQDQDAIARHVILSLQPPRQR